MFFFSQDLPETKLTEHVEPTVVGKHKTKFFYKEEDLNIIFFFIYL